MKLPKSLVTLLFIARPADNPTSARASLIPSLQSIYKRAGRVKRDDFVERVFEAAQRSHLHLLQKLSIQAKVRVGENRHLKAKTCLNGRF
jgi:hypothetical protein